MKDVWHIHGAPLLLANAFLHRKLMGLLDVQAEGVLTVAMAIPEDAPDVRFHFLPGVPFRGLADYNFLDNVEPYVFRIDRPNQRLIYVEPAPARPVPSGP